MAREYERSWFLGDKSHQGNKGRACFYLARRNLPALVTGENTHGRLSLKEE